EDKYAKAVSAYKVGTGANDEKDYDYSGLTEISGKDVGAYALGMPDAKFENKNANYTVASFDVAQDATLTILPLAVTVEAKSIVPKNYGKPDPDADTLKKDLKLTAKAAGEQVATIDGEQVETAQTFDNALAEILSKLSVRRETDADTEGIFSEGVGRYNVYITTETGDSCKVEGSKDFDGNFLVTFDGSDKFEITNLVDVEFDSETKTYTSRQPTFTLNTSLVEEVGATMDVEISATNDAPSYLDGTLQNIVGKDVLYTGEGKFGTYKYSDGAGHDWTGNLPAGTALEVVTVTGLSKSKVSCRLQLASDCTASIIAHPYDRITAKYEGYNGIFGGDGLGSIILGDSGSLVITGPNGEWVVATFGDVVRYAQISGGKAVFALTEADDTSLVVKGQKIDSFTTWTVRLLDDVKNLTENSVSGSVAIDDAGSTDGTVSGFKNRGDTVTLNLGEIPGTDISVSVGGLSTTISLDSSKTDGNGYTFDFFKLWSPAPPTMLKAGDSISVTYKDRVGHDCTLGDNAGRSTAQAGIQIEATPSMKRSMGRLVGMDLALSGLAENYEEIELTTDHGGSANATAKGSGAFVHGKTGRWAATIDLSDAQLPEGDTAVVVNGRYRNVNGSGQSAPVPYVKLYQPMVVLSRVNPRDNVIYGFMDARTTVHITITHEDGTADAFNSRNNGDMFETGSTNKTLGYFMFTYGRRFMPGDKIRLWYVAENEAVDERLIYEFVVPAEAENYAGNAEALGMNITEWPAGNVGEPKQAFVVPVEVSKLAMNPNKYADIPLILFMGYEAGTFSLVSENGQLWVADLDAGSYARGEGVVRVFYQKPTIAQLSNGGTVVKVGESIPIPAGVSIVWVYAAVPVEIDEYTIGMHEASVVLTGNQNHLINRVTERNSEWYGLYKEFQEVADQLGDAASPAA
ncbi:MAG: hypothetical protein ACSW8H_01430, partial [bacterium]